jgi:pimeloyl-ACP methyl ester carboxylesterase
MSIYVPNVAKALLLTLLIAFNSACTSSSNSGGGDDNGNPKNLGNTPAVAGQVYQVTQLASLTLDQLRAQKRGFPLAPGLSLEDLFPSRCGADLYKVEYATTDTSNQMVRVSGLMVIPTGSRRPAPMLSYQHGTETDRTDVPSNPANSEAQILSGVYGGSCYIVVAADYIGLGVNTGFHPYLHADTGAFTSADLIQAAMSRFNGLRVDWNNQLFLAGYSQGGHVTMALHRHLERSVITTPQVTASAPMAGPYDLSNTSVVISLNNPSANTSLYGAYLIHSMNSIYSIFPDLSAIMTPAVAAAIPGLFDGSKTSQAVREALPARPDGFLTPAFMGSITRSEDTAFNRALRQNDVYEWAPRAPVRLYHGGADLDVPYDNAVIARDYMMANGAADVQVVNVGAGLTHPTAYFPSMRAAYVWFESLRAN